MSIPDTPYTKNALSRDAELAKKRLVTGNLNLAIVKQGTTIFTSLESGIRGLIEAIESCRSSLRGAAAADRVLGKAAALLCVYAEFSSVYACVISKPAAEVLKRSSIPFQYDELVQNILNAHETDICPFESLVLGIDSPEEALLVLKRRLSGDVSRSAC